MVHRACRAIREVCDAANNPCGKLFECSVKVNDQENTFLDVRDWVPSLKEILRGGSHSAQYFGKLIGKLSELHHGVSGEVYAVDGRTLYIKDFTYDGQGPDDSYTLHIAFSSRISILSQTTRRSRRRQVNAINV
ncbi:unnamed protein product [Phaedon cochleariae]|uniref:DM13 domain-containing protein n=1 Tax=Phaedon cochleariae TaxID=80249 RepID=A0A9N9SJA3_PHACE|nr:unnamed protein product [Phaedon cochleariae]